VRGKQPERVRGVVSYVHTEFAAGHDADQAVAELYRSHAGTMIRLAIVIIRDPAMAEDVVQDAFCGLYRRWPQLSGPDRALPYVRTAVLNGCRSVLRHRARRTGTQVAEPAAPSAERDALAGEEHRAVLAGLRELPPRQREAIALRFLAGLDDTEIAQAMGISRGTVKSTISRGLAALAKQLGADL
jgi:RNA polymerase sigma-70 factor (sigma-E family)